MCFNACRWWSSARNKENLWKLFMASAIFPLALVSPDQTSSHPFNVVVVSLFIPILLPCPICFCYTPNIFWSDISVSEERGKCAFWTWGKESFLCLSKFLLAGSRLKLTWDRFIGENKIQFCTMGTTHTQVVQRQEKYRPNEWGMGQMLQREDADAQESKNRCLRNRCLPCHADGSLR